jgi:hypothetical protein
MKIFTYSEARQNFSKLLTMAQTQDIEIRRKDGSAFILKAKVIPVGSPFDVASPLVNIDSDVIVDAVRESRQR